MNVVEQGRQIWTARRAYQSGQLGTAHAIAVDLLSYDPRNLDALEIKALAEIERGDDAAAEQTLRAALSCARDEGWPYAGLSELLKRNGRLPEAEAVSRAALAANPDDADAHDKLGVLLAMRMKAHDAAAHFRRAIALAGPEPQLLTRLGHALLRLGRLDEAREPLKTAAADPDSFEAIVYLAELEERVGRLQAAMELLDRAEKLPRAPGSSLARQRSVLLARMGRHNEALALLENTTDLSGAAQLQRGRLRERAERHAEAWSDWTIAKERLGQVPGRQYPTEVVRALAERLAAFFASPEASALPRAERRDDVPQPIFIAGSPRSGTTLTERILASHSAVEAGGELPFGTELQEFAVALAGGEWSFPAGLLRAEAGWVDKLRDLYLDRAREFGLFESGARFFTDKMPSNDFWLPLLRLAFPESAIILVRRHPLDVLTSIMAHEMTHGFYSAYRLEDAARHFALSDWLVEQYSAAGFGPTFNLRYETLVASQAEETERLTAAVGLEMEPEQLTFHERGAVPATPSYEQVRQPLNDRSIGNWRNHAAEFEPVLPLLAEAMARGGYTD
jgi:Flp pilus assembly protein TadD